MTYRLTLTATSDYTGGDLLVIEADTLADLVDAVHDDGRTATEDLHITQDSATQYIATLLGIHERDVHVEEIPPTGTFEIDAMLGDVAAEATRAQRQAIQDAADTIAARYPDTDLDLEDVRTETLSGAVQVILDDDTLEGLAAGWRRAADLEREAKLLFDGAIIAAHLAGTSEQQIAARCGFGANRTTVRRVLGK